MRPPAAMEVRTAAEAVDQPPGWVEVGVLTAGGYEQLHGPLPERCEFLLRANGKAAHIERDFSLGSIIPEVVVRHNGRGGLVFCGEDIGPEPIRVAALLKVDSVPPEILHARV